jgi:hypothetical protein
MILALAGRRIDADGARPPRFPLGNAGVVRERLRALLRAEQPAALVSSAACGADLLALLEAGTLGIGRRVVLPFERHRFRGSSVTDRPGDWGSSFDLVVDDVTARGDLVVLEGPDGDEAYAAANGRILDEALRLAASPQDAAAVLVWEGASRGAGDLTAAFGDGAAARGLRVVHIKTV